MSKENHVIKTITVEDPLEISIEKEWTNDVNLNSCESILFFPEQNILVAPNVSFLTHKTRYDKTLGLIDITTSKLVHSYKTKAGLKVRAGHGIKYGPSSFAYCCDKHVTFLSILPPFKNLKTINLEKLTYRLLKIPHKNQLLCQSYPSTVYLVDVETEKVLKEWYIGHIVWNPCLRMSKKIKSSFFINTHDKVETIRQIDIENEMILKEFKGHERRVLGIENLVIKNEENIIAVSRSEGKDGKDGDMMFYQYRVSDEKHGKPKRISDLKRTPDRERTKLKGSYSSLSSRMVENQFLLVTDRSANGMSFFEFFCEGKDLVARKYQHFKCFSKDKNKTVGVKGFECWVSKSENCLNIFAGEELGLGHFKVKGLKFRGKRSEEEIQDLNERIFFLRENVELFVFSEEERKNVFVEMKFSGGGVLNCLRVLFY